jgi:hypothetical protein
MGGKLINTLCWMWKFIQHRVLTWKLLVEAQIRGVRGVTTTHTSNKDEITNTDHEMQL